MAATGLASKTSVHSLCEQDEVAGWPCRSAYRDAASGGRRHRPDRLDRGRRHHLLDDADASGDRAQRVGRVGDT